MKRASRKPFGKRAARRPKLLSFDQFCNYANAMADLHHSEWQKELVHAAPNWIYLLGLHLRLIELERLEESAGELL